MTNWFKKCFSSKQNDIFVKQMTEDERNSTIAIFFKHLSQLYASNGPALRVPVGNFKLVKMMFYYELAKKLLADMNLNISIHRHGVSEDTTNPEDRYFELKIDE